MMGSYPIPLSRFEVSARAESIFREMGLHTLVDLRVAPVSRIEQHRHAGPKVVSEILALKAVSPLVEFR